MAKSPLRVACALALLLAGEGATVLDAELGFERSTPRRALNSGCVTPDPPARPRPSSAPPPPNTSALQNPTQPVATAGAQAATYADCGTALAKTAAFSKLGGLLKTAGPALANSAAGAKLLALLTDKTTKATVFIPTNAAFTAFKMRYGLDITDPSTLAMLSAYSPTALSSILLYHDVPGVKLLLAGLTNGKQLTTLLGAASAKLRVTVTGGGAGTPTAAYKITGLASSAKIVKTSANIACGAAVLHGMFFFVCVIARGAADRVHAR